MKKIKGKRIIIGIGIFVLLLIVVEVTLRAVWGFGKMPLYAASDKWEYMPLPNQSGVRLGNKYYYNRYGMRSAEVDTTKRHVLGLGDSVIHGGVQTDQDSLATSLFTAETGVQMLNISVGGWDPDNCAAYLKEYGMFGAEGVFLFVSSGNAHSNMDFTPTVGVHVNYPDKQYPCAIAEVWCRYVFPRYIQPIFEDKKEMALDPDEMVFNKGFDQLKQMCDNDSIRMIVYLHASKNELKNHKYNWQGDEIIEWCEDNGVELIKSLDYDFKESDYRDGIHINSHGQRKVADIMEKAFGF